MSFLMILLLVFFSLSSNKISLASITTGIKQTESQKQNPFTPKSSLNRYWNNQISNKLPKPTFLLSKSTPLNPIDTAIFTKLASQNSLSSHFDSFCSKANLFCSFDTNPDVSPHKTDSNFASYANKNFVNYGTSQLGRLDSFKNYSNELNSPNDSFKKYSKGSTSHSEIFTNYADEANVATSNFTSYASDSVSGSGEFKNYDQRVNVPNLKFTSYDSNANKHKLTFTTYSGETNSGSQTFMSYGKNGNGNPNEFNNYSEESNIIGSGFTGYGESGNSQNDSFKGYGLSGNNPHNNFKTYGVGGNAAIDSFANYRNGANVGDDSFQSYARNSNSDQVSFTNYGRSFNEGNDSFREYGKGSLGRTTVGFKSYSLGRTFKDYAKNGVTFTQYNNFTTTKADSSTDSGKFVIKGVEVGKFFRELDLQQGNVMMMPDIRDKMPKRSFLPRSILSKLPFSSSKVTELKEIFHAREDSNTERVIMNALEECERAPSHGETKRCVGSIEDMMDFAISVLGHNVVVRTTENVKGSKKEVLIGEVKAINGGKITKSVSCHQSMYPYLLYYCHSVPKVRVYEADILEVESKKRINHGVAICHIDTSSWSQVHGAFVALGHGPGQIEVCHWIFENDMTWAVADH